MGFFNILETFFFVSLAITFVLIMMLVYHFKGRINVLEQKCDTMFDIMNNMVKELRTIKMNCNTSIPHNEMMMMFNQNHNLGEMFKKNPNDDVDIDIDVDAIDGIDDDDDDDENDDIEVDIPDDNDDPANFQKIIVSDTECEQPIKIINIDFDDKNNSDELDEVDELNEVDDESIDEPNSEGVFTPDYKKMDTNYLRTMVISRGLATDTKKLKKNDLIKLLQQSEQ